MKKNLLTTILAILVLFTNATMTYAENPENMESIWNYSLIDEGAEVLYEQFPMTSHKTIIENMGMDLIFQYVKNIEEEDVVNVVIKDTADDSIILEKSLATDDNIVYFGNVPNEKIYSITVDENRNGISNQYVRYIETKYIVADFPANLTLGNTMLENNNGETFSKIYIKKVGDNPISVIENTQLDTFYHELDSDNYYELQMNASKDGVTRFYQGFISTYANGEYDGVFTRGYELRENFVNTVSYSMRSLNSGYDVSDGYVYEQYRTEYAELTGSQELLVRFIPPTTGTYTIETIGNLDTMLVVYSVVNGTVKETSYAVDRDSGEGENGMIQYQFLVDDTTRPEKFIVVKLESGEGGYLGFRIIPHLDTFNDDFINNREIMKEICDEGGGSAAVNEGYINYHGDIDVFGYDVTSGTGNLMMTAGISRVVQSVVYYIDPLTTEYDPWVKGTYTSGSLHSIALNEGRHYFEVEQPSGRLPEFNTNNDDYYETNSYNYTFTFTEPGLKDSMDAAAHSVYGNDTPIYTTEITTFPFLSMDTLTLHKGDNDMFSFTTGSSYSDITIIVDQLVNDKYYIPHLYDASEIEIYNSVSPEWSIPVDLADYEINEGINATLTYEGLLPNHEYIINITTENNNDYSSYYKYVLEVILSEAEVAAATLNGNVTLTHTIGENITSLDAFKNSIMESMTCTLDGVAVADSEALDHVVLYNGNEVLTVEGVNALAAGTYTITPKYRGVTATGGTVTLEVSTSGTQVQLSGITMITVIEDEWDWAACAKMMADIRLSREGTALSTKSVPQALLAIKGAANLNERGSLSETANAANYFYTSGSLDTYNFYQTSITETTAENSLLAELQAGKAVILMLESASQPDSIALARYVLLVGIDTGADTYTVMDPFLGTTTSVSHTVLFEGGYNGNTDLVFTGTVIEFI